MSPSRCREQRHDLSHAPDADSQPAHRDIDEGRLDLWLVGRDVLAFLGVHRHRVTVVSSSAARAPPLSTSSSSLPTPSSPQFKEARFPESRASEEHTPTHGFPEASSIWACSSACVLSTGRPAELGSLRFWRLDIVLLCAGEVVMSEKNDEPVNAG